MSPDRAISARKQKHIEISVNPEKYKIEGEIKNGFESIHFVHEAFPELDYEKIDASTTFLGKRISLPILISCMTGGTSKALQANTELAQAAQLTRIPMGLGSIKILFQDPKFFKDFQIRSIAPDIPILANMGAVQVRDTPQNRIIEVLQKLEVDALVIHLNAGQELFQPDGDRNFIGLLTPIEKLCKNNPFPIVVKETGFGIRPRRVKQLLEAGVAYIDLAGSSGTNWILVESYKNSQEDREIAKEFTNWGIPTALLLASLEKWPDRIIASGGLRSGMDIAKAIAMGAVLAGMALPFIRDVQQGGKQRVVKRIKNIERLLKTVMLLTGSTHLEDLRRAERWMEPEFSERVSRLKHAEGF